MNLDEYRAWAKPRCKEVPYLPGEMPCLVWQGATINKGKDPRAVMKRGFPPTQVRRGAWEALHPDSQLGKDSATPTCECPLCVEPTHLRRITSSEYRSVPKSLAARLHMREVARRNRSKVKDPETTVPMVIADPRPAHLVAKELGIGEDVVQDIRRGKWNMEAFGRGNPFAGLMTT